MMPDKALRFILNAEGGLSNDPLDRGGLTNFGIRQATLDGWRKYHPDFPTSVRSLTIPQVKAIYERQYWQAAGCELMPWPLSLAVFDMSVNSGPGRSVEYLQRALNSFGATLATDGGFGPLTQAALKWILSGTGPVPIGLRHIAWRREFIKAIVYGNPALGFEHGDPTQVRFLRGWNNRLDRLERAVRQG
jgi:lysozyme family protein